MTVECSICGQSIYLKPGDHGPLTWFRAHYEQWHSDRPMVAMEIGI